MFKSLTFLSSSKYISSYTHFLKNGCYLSPPPNPKNTWCGPCYNSRPFGLLFLVLQTASNPAPPSLLLCDFQTQILSQTTTVTLCRVCSCPLCSWWTVPSAPCLSTQSAFIQVPVQAPHWGKLCTWAHIDSSPLWTSSEQSCEIKSAGLALLSCMSFVRQWVSTPRDRHFLSFCVSSAACELCVCGLLNKFTIGWINVSKRVVGLLVITLFLREQDTKI